MNGGRFLACTLLVLAAGCGAAEPVPGSAEAALPDRDRFIAVMIELREASRSAESMEGFQAARDEILARHGVSADALVRFAAARGSRLDEMAQVWDSINARLTATAPREAIQ